MHVRQVLGVSEREACRQFLPRNQQNMTRVEWLEKTGVNDAVDKIVAGQGVKVKGTGFFLSEEIDILHRNYINIDDQIGFMHEIGHARRQQMIDIEAQAGQIARLIEQFRR